MYTKFNKTLTQAIVTDPAFIAMKASGRSEAFIKSNDSVLVQKGKFVKFALNAYEMDHGRGKTVNRTGGFTQAIYDWLSYKKYDLNWKDDKQRRGMAIAIARKTSIYGSFKRRNPDKQTDIFGKAVKKALPVLVQDVFKVEVKAVLSGINI